MPKDFSGSKGAGDYNRTADNLFSTDSVEVLLGISEGPIAGLVDGKESFYVGDTPLQSASGDSNFPSTYLRVYNGAEAGVDIKSRLGGFGASTSVGVTLEEGIPVVRSGLQSAIDFLEVRLVINALYRRDPGGEYASEGQVRIEYQKQGATSWTPATTFTEDGELDQEVRVVGSNWDIPAVTLDSASAAANIPGAVWISGGLIPKIKNSSGDWIDAGGVQVYSGSSAPFAFSDAYNAQNRHIWYKSASEITVFNGVAWVTPGSSSKVAANTSPASAGAIKVSGKTTSGVVKEYRIPVERDEGATYNLRVTVVSGNAGDVGDDNQSVFVVTWDSFQEISGDNYNFPGLAVTQFMAQASNQFNSIPELTGVYRGRIVRVPTNYNPETRIYSGVWDGTWKLAYTNNPAFIGYDLVTNTRYGMNAYYPVVLNKWDVYEAAQWADTRTEDGTPRFTFNGLIQDAQNGRETINYVFGILGARFFDDGNGQAVLRIDRNDAPVAVFGNANVSEGQFVYTFAPLSEQFNDYTVSFINPDLNWATDRRRVYDQAHIDRYGRITKNFDAVGCTSVSEAIRRARYQMVTSLTETTTVSFKTNRQASMIQPYDIILVADEDTGMGWTGRVKGLVSNAPRQFDIRDPLHLESGFEYVCHFHVPTSDGLQVFTLPVDATYVGSSRTRFRVTQEIPDEVGPDTVFSIGQVGTKVAPRPFRVMGIQPDADNPDSVSVQAIEVNRNKWTYIDGWVDDIPTDLPGDSSLLAPLPVPSLSVEGTINRGKVTLNVSWKRSPSAKVSEYEVEYSLNGDPTIVVGRVTGRKIVLEDMPRGEYLIGVRPINRAGIPGPVRYTSYRAYSLPQGLPTLKGVSLQVRKSLQPDGSFVARIAGSWTAISGRDDVNFQISYGLSSESDRTEFNTLKNRFVTPPLLAQGGYAVSIIAYSGTNQVRQEWTGTLLVTGDTTIPGVPTGWVGDPGVGAIYLRGDPSNETDFKEFVIYNATTQNGTYQQIATTSGTEFVRKVSSSSDPWDWYKVSQRDRSGNESPRTAAIRVEPMTLDIDDEAPDIPTGLTITSTPKRATATWSASSAEDFAYFDVILRVNGGNEISFQTSRPRYEWDLPPNTAITAQVRAVDALGNRSDYTGVVAHTTAKDTTPPAVPSGLALKAGFNTLWISWDRNTEEDFSHYEVAVDAAPFSTNVAPSKILWRGVSNSAVLSELPDSTRRFVRIRAVDTSGNASGWTEILDKTLPGGPAIDQEALQSIINQTSVAAGLDPIKVHTGISLPSGKISNLISWNGKLYSWDGTKYVVPIHPANADEILLNGTVKTPHVAAGAIGVDQLAARAATIEKLAVGDFTNLVLNNWTGGSFDGWTVTGGAAVVQNRTDTVFVSAGVAGNMVVYSGGDWGLRSPRADVDSGQELYVEVFVRPSPTSVPNGTIGVQVRWTLSDGTTSYTTVGSTSAAGVIKLSKMVKAPVNAVDASLWIRPNVSGTTGTVFLARPVLRKAVGGELVVDGALSARHMRADTLVVTESAQIKEAIIKDAHIADLTAEKITAGSTLSGTVKVSDEALSSIKDKAGNPAPQINAGSTLIEPGKLRISGGTTLADWRKGGDLTRIDGGVVAPNTLKANTAVIGMRNISVTGIRFEHDSPSQNRAAWTSGFIEYVDNDGEVKRQTISAGVTGSYSGNTLYISWLRGNTSLTSSTSRVSSFHDDRIVLATYDGGDRLNSTYGRTVIDGGGIKTDSIDVQHLVKTHAIITHKAQLDEAIIGTAHIDDLTVTRLKIRDGAVTTWHTSNLGGKLKSSKTAMIRLAGFSMKKTTNKPVPIWFGATYPQGAILQLQRRIGKTGAWVTLKTITDTRYSTTLMDSDRPIHTLTAVHSGTEFSIVDKIKSTGTVYYRLMGRAYAVSNLNTSSLSSPNPLVGAAHPFSKRFVGALNSHK